MCGYWYFINLLVVHEILWLLLSSYQTISICYLMHMSGSLYSNPESVPFLRRAINYETIRWLAPLFASNEWKLDSNGARLLAAYSH